MKKDQSATSPDYVEIQKRVFSESKIVKGDILIGGELLKPEIRSLLRDQAKNLQTTQLWEILNGSTLNEAINTGLLQGNIEFGQAIWHWSVFVRTIVNKLAKD